MTYLRLFWNFFKTGLFSIGGGMATIPFLQDMGHDTGWFTSGQLADMLAVSESTPGPIGVNMSTYTGYIVCLEEYKSPVCGVLGGIVATIGLVTPSVIIILIVASILDKFRKNKYVEMGFYGLRPASLGLIAAAGICVALIAFFGLEDVYGLIDCIKTGTLSTNFIYVILAAVLIVLTRFVKKTKNWHPIVFIALSALVGIIFSL